jgi:hypothetical protein
MPLYKATATVTTYFMSDRKGRSLEGEAEDFIGQFAAEEQVFTNLEITRILRKEKLAEGWTRNSYVYGSEEATGEEPMSLSVAMEMADTLTHLAEQEEKKKPVPPKKKTAMPAKKGASR